MMLLDFPSRCRASGQTRPRGGPSGSWGGRQPALLGRFALATIAVFESDTGEGDGLRPALTLGIPLLPPFVTLATTFTRESQHAHFKSRSRSPTLAISSAAAAIASDGSGAYLFALFPLPVFLVGIAGLRRP